MKTSAAGINLIKEFEGVRLKAYRCPADVWTIGVGHTSAAGPPVVKAGMEITNAQAMKILANDLVKFEDGVDSAVKVPLKQNQFDALVSFAFNVGLGALAKSTLLRKLNAGQYDAVPAELMKWTKAAGKELPGLVRRRRAEAALWRGVDDSKVIKQDARVEPDAPKPSKTMVQSKEGNAAMLTGGAATLSAVNDAAQQVKETGDTFTSLLDLLKSPSFLLTLLIIVAAAAIWYWRWQRLKEDGA
jgi:lysozyme